MGRGWELHFYIGKDQALYKWVKERDISKKLKIMLKKKMELVFCAFPEPCIHQDALLHYKVL